MKATLNVRVALLAILLIAGGFEFAEWFAIPGVRGPVSTTVEAEVGRPLTPVSVSGVARRTARRN